MLVATDLLSYVNWNIESGVMPSRQACKRSEILRRVIESTQVHLAPAPCSCTAAARHNPHGQTRDSEDSGHATRCVV